MSKRNRRLKVTVKLYSDLRRHLRGRPDPFQIELPAGADVATLIRGLEIDPSRDEITIGINGELGQPDSILSDGDEVMLVSPMQGGRTDFGLGRNSIQNPKSKI